MSILWEQSSSSVSYNLFVTSYFLIDDFFQSNDFFKIVLCYIIINIIIILKSYIAYVSTKQGTQGAESVCASFLTIYLVNLRLSFLWEQSPAMLSHNLCVISCFLYDNFFQYNDFFQSSSLLHPHHHHHVVGQYFLNFSTHKSSTHCVLNYFYPSDYTSRPRSQNIFLNKTSADKKSSSKQILLCIFHFLRDSGQKVLIAKVYNPHPTCPKHKLPSMINFVTYSSAILWLFCFAQGEDSQSFLWVVATRHNWQ